MGDMSDDFSNDSKIDNCSANFKRKEELKENAIKEMKYLLVNCQKYSNYFNNKYSMINQKSIESVDIHESQNDLKQKFDSSVNNQILLNYFEGKLYNYQECGVKWMKHLFEYGINGILADEMGLGKTIQIIALICNLIENKIPGPYLIVAPLATLPNWKSEFERFAPKLPVILFYGNRNERFNQKFKVRETYKVDNFSTGPIVLISFQYPAKELQFLKQFRWQYLIIDEGHNIKNHKSQLICCLRQIPSLNRLILTGTPLQNNLVELWSLLNFLLPQIFRDAKVFSSLFEAGDFEETTKILEQEQNTNIISTIHGVLQPFMLRRLKSDVLIHNVPKKEVLVYCPLTDLQRDLYKYVLQENIIELLGKDKAKEETTEKTRKRRKCAKYSDVDVDKAEKSGDIKSNTRFKYLKSDESKSIIAIVKMASPIVILRKIVNHPFTVHYPVYPGTRDIIINEEIIKQSGKMLVLDAMLSKLKENGHKVLIFSTMTQVLDFVEDYLYLRNYQYSRLDGKCTSLAHRQENINLFKNSSEVFVFLISTRAGGLGLNLVEADTVIFYDRDWNPQVDIQAQDRCHRIGQTKPVVVYSLVTKGTIDEKILQKAHNKIRLEKVVIKKGKFTEQNPPKKMLDLNELEELLKSVDNKEIIQANRNIFTEDELNNLMDRSDLYNEMNQVSKTIRN